MVCSYSWPCVFAGFWGFPKAHPDIQHAPGKLGLLLLAYLAPQLLALLLSLLCGVQFLPQVHIKPPMLQFGGVQQLL